MPSVSRRRLLAAITTGSLAGLAGCSSSCPDEGRPDPETVVEAGSPPAGPFESSPAGTWSAPRFDGANTGYAAGASSPPDTVGIRWRTRLETPDGETVTGMSAPTAAAGKAYLATAAGITALDLRDGEVLWEVDDITPATMGRTFGYGDEVVPPIVGPSGTVYVGTRDALVALNPADGTEKWRHETLVTGAPAFFDESVFVATEDGFLAVTAAEGMELWTAPVGEGTTLPALTAGTIVVVDERTRALDVTTGDQRWETDLTPEYYPVIGDDIVYLGDFDGLHAVGIGDGATEWTFERGDGRGMSAPVVTPETIYVVEEPGEAGEATFALDRDGTPPSPRWCSDVGDGAVTAATDDRVFGLQSPGGPSSEPQLGLVAFTERFGEATWGLAGGGGVLPPAILDGAAVVARRDGLVFGLGGV